MSMPSSEISAKAVVGISEIHFLKWINGQEPTVNDNLFQSGGSHDWFSVATIKGSVTCSQDAQSVTKVAIDQSNMPIGISTEPGDFNVEAQFPSMITSALSKWLNKSSGNAISISDSNNNSRSGYGYDFNTTLTSVVMAIKTQTGDWIVFPNVKGDVAFGMEDNVWVLKFSGSVLGAENDSNKPVYVFADADANNIGLAVGAANLDFGTIVKDTTEKRSVNVKCPGCTADSLTITVTGAGLTTSPAGSIAKSAVTGQYAESGTSLQIIWAPTAAANDFSGSVVITHGTGTSAISKTINITGIATAQ